jgi:hypothetical protein
MTKNEHNKKNAFFFSENWLKIALKILIIILAPPVLCVLADFLKVTEALLPVVGPLPLRLQVHTEGHGLRPEGWSLRSDGRRERGTGSRFDESISAGIYRQKLTGGVFDKWENVFYALW